MRLVNKRGMKPQRNKDKNRNNNYYRPNFWGMVRDIIIASFNKGIFLPVGIWLLFLILFLKLNHEDALYLLVNFRTLLLDLRILGWFLFGITVILWCFSVKRLRRVHAEEMRRVSEEKKGYQEKELGQKLGSSNN